ncbi:COQ9 family protein [Caenispirillum salinarum]|uniref:COQ9 family protein n=1 Tax=Caenispirillum salinarum TaxID=859058 RepID=UPI00384B4626
MDLIASRDAVVQRALFHVPFDGWSMKTLRHACDDEDLGPGAAERLFPGGVAEAITHFADLADRMMMEDMAADDLTGLNTPARIKRAIQLRLTRWAGDREAIRRAVATLSLPQYAGQSIRSTAKTVDAIWKAAGDQSADFSWYTKRLTLAPIYTATLLYWFEDTSEDFEDTWDFLDRQFRAVGVIPSVEKRLKNAFGKLPDPRKMMPKPPRFGAQRSPFRR